MNLNYNKNIPFAANNPSVDQPKMQVNTNSISSWVAVDHHGFDDNLGGYHTDIHQDPIGTRIGSVFTGVPASIPNINQTFVLNVTPDTTGGVTDTQLFCFTGNGSGINGLSQLTGDFSSGEGYQWIGGVLLQWGKVLKQFDTAPLPTSGTVIFKDRSPTPSTIPFPNQLFSVVMTPIFDPTVLSPNAKVATISIDANASFGGTEFNWVATISPTTIGFKGFYWMAVGN